MIQLIEEPFLIYGNEVHIGVSIGIAECNAQNQLSAPTMLEQADMAMYEAKATTEARPRMSRKCASNPRK